MKKYVLKRLLLIIPVVIGVTFLIFFIMNLTPSSPGAIILGPSATAEEIEAYNISLGYDKPFIYRFFLYLYNMFFHADLGISYAYKTAVTELVFSRLADTVFLSFSAVCVAAVVGIIVGVASAVKQYSALDRGATFLSMLFAAIPSFWLAMLMIYVFALKLMWLPAFGADSLKNFILPAVSLGIPYAAQILRHTRSSMLDCIRQDYVDTAKSKGLPKRKVVWTHAFRNAVLPVITVTGQTFGSLIGGAVVTEQLYGISGVGTLLVAAIKSRDIPVVCGSVVVLATIFSLVILAVDLLHAYVDPRVRARYSAKKG